MEALVLHFQAAKCGNRVNCQPTQLRSNDDSLPANPLGNNLFTKCNADGTIYARSVCVMDRGDLG